MATSLAARPPRRLVHRRGGPTGQPACCATRRLDLAGEIYHLGEPDKIPLVMSLDEMRRLLAVASSLKVRVLLSLGYGCGLRAHPSDAS